MLRDGLRCGIVLTMEVLTEQLTRVKLQRLIRELGGQSAVAGLLGVHRSRITRWLVGEEPDPRNRAKLDALEFVLARLLQTFSPTTARKWLGGINAHLGNRRPVDFIASNRVAEVIGAIEQADLDSYA